MRHFNCSEGSVQGVQPHPLHPKNNDGKRLGLFLRSPFSFKFSKIRKIKDARKISDESRETDQNVLHPLPKTYSQ